LAEKTCKIMSDYQAYLAEIETEFPSSPGSDSEAERNIEREREAHRYRDNPAGTFPPPDEEEASYGNNGGLYRGWSHGSGGGGGHIKIDRGVADLEDYPHAMMSVRRPKRSYKKVKKGLIAAIALIFIVGVSVGVSKKRKEESLPDWEAELAEAQGGQKSPMNGGEPPEEHPEMAPEVMGPPDGEITEALAAMYQSVTGQFQPKFYDRSTGWTGQTYIEALEFCQTDNAYSPGMMRVCPYVAVCPGGQGSRPLNGHKNENTPEQAIMDYGGSWVPVIDGPNEWVSIGNDNSCVMYSTLKGEGPAWGESGEGNEQNTRHVMCCDAAAVEVAEEDLMQQMNKEEDAMTAMGLDAGGMSQENPTEQDLFGEIANAEGPTIQDTVAQVEAEGDIPEGEDEELPYIISASKYQPIYNTRADGWTGSTYKDAVEYCSGISDGIHMLCPFEALCPAGLGEMPMGTFEGIDGEMMWIPGKESILVAYIW
jgi:hypothetical protein